MPIVTRFAPSPTGYLHLGHVLAARYAHDAARESGGDFLVRLEDIDPVRCRPEFADAILEDLRWLGLNWDGPVRVQSQHMDDYQRALDHLRQQDLLYPCFCTRKDIKDEIARSADAPHGPDGPLYGGRCRSLSKQERQQRINDGHPFALRLDMMRACNMVCTPLRWHDRRAGWTEATPQLFGDVVLARKDCPTSYHLAVTVDDALQGVTLVTRGEDLFAASHLHCLLQHLLGLPQPDYAHHPLICGPDGKRLAKRDHAQTIRSLREAGQTPQQVLNSLDFGL